MITKTQFQSLEELFSYYNQVLFNNELPDCLVTLERHRGKAGYFLRNSWVDASQVEEGGKIHQIALNPEMLLVSEMELHQTIVHEMCHLWQQVFGSPSRNGYHNREWANKMIGVGLMPSSTGRPGGAITGQNMADYVIEGGEFEKSFKAISENDLKNLILPFQPNRTLQLVINANGELEGGEQVEGTSEQTKEKPKSGRKVKYTCNCGHNVWGKSSLQLQCNECNQPYHEQ